MLILADPLHLSALQTKFSYNGRTFTNCVLLHRLIITRQDEEILRRRHQLDPALLARTFEYQSGSSSYSWSQVRYTIR